MLNLLKRLFSGSQDPVAYQLPLAWFDQQLPADLLSTGLHWVWESSRGGKAARPNVPAHREPTILTQALAAEITAELGEYEGEIGRAFLAFATASPMETTASELVKAIRTFARSGEGPLIAIIHQNPEGPALFFLSRTPPAQLSQLLDTWASRMGKAVKQIEQQPKAAGILKRIFLDSKTARPLRGLPR